MKTDTTSSIMGNMTYWYTNRVSMSLAHLNKCIQSVTIMSGDEFDEVMEMDLLQDVYFCSATHESKKSIPISWNDCSAFPEVLYHICNSLKPVVVAECVERGNHPRNMDNCYLHSDGVLLWSPNIMFVRTITQTIQFGRFIPLFNQHTTNWAYFFQESPANEIDYLITHNFNRFYNHMLIHAYQQTFNKKIKIINNSGVGHFVSGDIIINLNQACESGLFGTFLLVAPGLNQWNWAKFYLRES